jgi:hypothetical protein
MPLEGYSVSQNSWADPQPGALRGANAKGAPRRVHETALEDEERQLGLLDIA